MRARKERLALVLIAWLERRKCRVTGIETDRRGAVSVSFVGPWNSESGAVDCISLDTLERMAGHG